MKKNIIISGKQCSGKSHIAKAISLQYKNEKVLHIYKSQIKNLIKNGVNILPKIHPTYSLIIIDEVNRADIILLETIFQKELITDKDLITDNAIVRRNNLRVVYLTLDKIIPKETELHVINCNNDIF